MADPNSTYAVVDMSKKKKNRTPAKKEALNSESAYYSTPSEYSMVTYDADSQELSAKPTTAADEEPEKSVSAKSSIQEPVSTTSAASVRDKIDRLTQILSDKESRKPVFCAIAITVTFIVLAIIIFSCIGALFTEIGKLELKIQAQQIPSNDSQHNWTLLAQQISTNRDQDRQMFERITQQLVNQQISFNTTLTALQSSLQNHLSLASENFQQGILELEMMINQNLTELRAELDTVRSELHTLQPGQRETNPACSCTALLPSSPSGYYWVRASNGSAVRVYCDMTRTCGNITGGWMRVAELNMTNSSHQCPSGLMERTMTSQPRTCVSTNPKRSCSNGTFFDTIITSYSNVCGKIIAFQKGNPNGFIENNKNISINSWYVDGVSLTHGSPRQHIWTFAAAFNLFNSSKCPGFGTPPTFVGTDYFCDTGATTTDDVKKNSFFADRPLWDCENNVTSCDPSGSPPWFHKELPPSTTDNIEMRVCRNENESFEDVAIEMIEIYVQ